MSKIEISQEVAKDCIAHLQFYFKTGENRENAQHALVLLAGFVAGDIEDETSTYSPPGQRADS